MRQLLFIPLTIMLLLKPISVRAEWYLSTHLGQASTDITEAAINNRLQQQGVTGQARLQNTHRIAWRLGVGYRWHDYLAVETAYTDLGQVDIDLIGTGPLSASVVKEAGISSGKGVEAAALASYPLSQTLQAYLRAGVWHWRSEYQQSQGPNGNLRGTEPLFGVGLDWRWQQHWSTRLSWDNYQVHNDNHHWLSLGLQYYFGHKTQPYIQPRQRQRNIITAAIQTPAVVQKPLAEQLPEQLSEPLPEQLPDNIQQLALQFSRGSATLTLDPSALQPLVQWLQTRPHVTLLIKGHTDNSGSQAFNDQLSQQRAKAVAQQLIALGARPSQLTTRGAGYSEPLATNTSASGRKKNRRVEFLLQTNSE